MTHKTEFLKRNKIKETSLSIPQIARYGGISLRDAREIVKRGKGAWKTNIASVRVKGSFKKDPTAPRSAKLSAEQWGVARLYSAVNKLQKIKLGKLKKLNQDNDILSKYL